MANGPVFVFSALWGYWKDLSVFGLGATVLYSEVLFQYFLQFRSGLFCLVVFSFLTWFLVYRYAVPVILSCRMRNLFREYLEL